MVAKLTLVGNLGMDPEVRFTAEGKPIVSCRVASNFRKRDAETREWADQTNWFRVSVFGRLAERLSEQANDGRLSKGSRIIVFGRLEATAYQDRSGQPQPSLDVIADDVIFADSRQRDADESGGDRDTSAGSARPPSRPMPAPRVTASVEQADEDLEDLPF